VSETRFGYTNLKIRTFFFRRNQAFLWEQTLEIKKYSFAQKIKFEKVHRNLENLLVRGNLKWVFV